MEEQDRSNMPELSGGAPLYRRPEPLNPNDHGAIGLLPVETPYAFAAQQHFVPGLITEFVPASTSYPLIFAGEERAPVIVMGLKTGQNLFAPEAFNRGEVYIPAYIRRYPFIAATSTNPDEMSAVICIDRDSDLVGENPAEPFYVGGEPTAYTNSCIQFCQNYEAERQYTREVIDRLMELDLFEYRTANYSPPAAYGQPQEPIEVAGFYAISGEKVNELPVETYIQLRDQQILGMIYAHWASQTQWDRIIARALYRDAQAAEAAGAAA